MTEEIKDTLERFLEKFPENTQRSYRGKIETFFEFSGIKNLRNYSTVKPFLIEFLEELESEGTKSNTLNLYISALRSFYKWLEEEEEIIEKNPIENIKYFSAKDVKKVSPPSSNEVEAILKSFNLESSRELRYWIGFVLLFSIDEPLPDILKARFCNIKKLIKNGSPTQAKRVREALELYKNRLKEDAEVSIDEQDYILASSYKKDVIPIDRSSMYRALKTKLLTLGLESSYSLQSCRFFARNNKEVKEGTFSIQTIEGKDDVFLSKKEIQIYLEELFRKKNVILQGPPGTGKSFLAEKLAQTISFGNEACIRQVQMHPSFHYEDFIQGFRPNEKGDLELKDGLFLGICREAKENPDNNYVLVIEEINRCDLNQVFGELLHLLDVSKRNEQNGLQLMYERSHKPFYVPPNVFVIATMNTADKSTVNIDYAMRRRFSFLDVKPQFESQSFEKYLVSCGLTSRDVKLLREKMDVINKEISRTKHLGEGFLIGHSYFCDQKKTLPFKEWLKMKFDFEIKPLLKEYWYDDLELVNKLVSLK